MLALAKYDFQHIHKPPPVFPPLVGSHRKLKTDNSNKQSSPKNFTPPPRQQQLNFLNRMKKAREVIFSHQRSKKILMQKSSRFMDRAKTDNTERIYINLEQKGFSQVVYNLGSGPKKIAKKDSIDNQKFNDKILRECKSSFMPNQKEKNKYYLKIPKKHQKTHQTELKNHPGPMFFHHNSQQKINEETKKTKIESTEKYLFQHLFPTDVISSNGEQLVQKLKKCREQKQNPQLVPTKQDKQNEQELQEEAEADKSQNSIQFPYNQGQSKNKGKSKFLNRMKGKTNRKIKISWQTMKSNNIQSAEPNEQNEVTGHTSQLSKIKEQDRKQKQKLKNQSKSAYFDENFKISAWNEQQAPEYEMF